MAPGGGREGQRRLMGVAIPAERLVGGRGHVIERGSGPQASHVIPPEQFHLDPQLLVHGHVGLE